MYAVCMYPNNLDVSNEDVTCHHVCVCVCVCACVCVCVCVCLDSSHECEIIKRNVSARFLNDSDDFFLIQRRVT